MCRRGRIFGRSGGEAEKRRGTAVVLRSGSEYVALGVDTVGAIDDVVLHPAPESAGKLSAVSGFCFDRDGNPVGVIQSTALADVARGAVQTTGGATASRLPILVVDDSLTTRMVQQSVLETAGYDVALATSAEEALQMIGEHDYGLFLVDVEMPGMNGFELVAALQADPKYRDIPAVLVTTLGSEEHRRRGVEAGARAYMVKSEFDERKLIQIVRRLMG
jgi:two-component system, chemotaxis family, sensor kinase CheA